MIENNKMDPTLAYLAMCLIIHSTTTAQHDRSFCDVCTATPGSCETVQGTFDLALLNSGYNPVVEIPTDACAINIYELEPSGNFLALKTSSNDDIINSRWAIAAPGEYPAAGTVFEYNRGWGLGCPGECVSAPGPTNQTVFVEILYYNENPGIVYYYKLHHEFSQRFSIPGGIEQVNDHSGKTYHRKDKHANTDQYDGSAEIVSPRQLTASSTEATPYQFKEDDLIQQPKISEHIAPKAIYKTKYLSSSSGHIRNYPHRKYRFNPSKRLGSNRGYFKETYGHMLQEHVFNKETITSSSSQSSSSSEDVEMYRIFEERNGLSVTDSSFIGTTQKYVPNTYAFRKVKLNTPTHPTKDSKTRPTTAKAISMATHRSLHQWKSNLENTAATTTTIQTPSKQQHTYTHLSTDIATTTETESSPTTLIPLQHVTSYISGRGYGDRTAGQGSFIPLDSVSPDSHSAKQTFWKGEYGVRGTPTRKVNTYGREEATFKEITNRKNSFISSSTEQGTSGSIVQQPQYHQQHQRKSFIRHSQEPYYVEGNTDPGIPLSRFQQLDTGGSVDTGNRKHSRNRNSEYPKSTYGRTGSREHRRRHHRRKDRTGGYFTNRIDTGTNGDIGDSNNHRHGDNTVDNNVIPLEYVHEGDQEVNQYPRRKGGELDTNAAYEWKISGFTNCTRECGEGSQETIIVCVRRNSHVTENNCDPSKKPSVQTIMCNKHICEPDWEAADWSQCSVRCGSGTQSRTVACKRRISSSLNFSVSASQCAEETKPAIIQQCGKLFCAAWDSSDWTPCSVTCGRGQQSRLVTCQESGNKVVSRNKCPRPAPRNRRTCSPGLCTRQWFVSTHSSQCSADCGSGLITRDVYCMSRRGRRLKDSHCSDTKPWSEQPCRANRICTGQWFTGPWSKCSAACGSGKRTRDVVCMERLGGAIASPLSDDACLKDDRPTEEETCQERYCDRKWFVTSWSKCSAECAGGYQTRNVQCLDGRQKRNKDCDTDMRPTSRQSCNQHDCSTEMNSTLSSGGCRDRYGHCHIVVQARLCKFPYYSNICCASCSLDKKEHLS